MNIKEATKHIKNTITAYLEKNENGEALIPVNKQRPIFLYGPPGIGKTAVMEQIASEMGIGIVSYSMTHHTRQSALGLPFIKTKSFGGVEYDVSEFTMSEILSDVYSYIEKTGHKNGILFLDEINCVSETLAPSMLRFLQYKTFGSHPVPEGWVIVAAGNPPEYNKSVKEYDIATLDRIQKIDISADYDIWREYAINEGVHPAIITYLDSKSTDFYLIDNTPDGKQFVTARGWEDMSRLMYSFEKKGFEIDAEFVSQYIQVPTVASDFSAFYSTFKKMSELCKAEEILNGSFNEALKEQLKNAEITERLGFINLLSNSVNEALEGVVLKNNSIKALAKALKEENEVLSEENDEIKKLKALIDELKSDAFEASKKLSNATKFVFEVLGDSPELKIFASNITRNTLSGQFLIGFGCDDFSEITKTKRSDASILEELNSLIL